MLREYERVPLGEFRNDRKTQDIVEREFERAIMACIDICQHLSAKLFSEVPESYASCFQVLGIPRNATVPAVLVTAYRPDVEQWTVDFLRRT